jgi:hypothetical protein
VSDHQRYADVLATPGADADDWAVLYEAETSDASLRGLSADEICAVLSPVASAGAWSGAWAVASAGARAGASASAWSGAWAVASASAGAGASARAGAEARARAWV